LHLSKQSEKIQLTSSNWIQNSIILHG